MINDNSDKSNVFPLFQALESEFCVTKSIETLKNIIDVYIDVYNNNELIGEYDIVDSTILMLSNNPSCELLDYLNGKYEVLEDGDLKAEILELINLIKIHLQ